MANIIEQQDLLKGLTNDRIALLMQNPVGDMPPFLVAAEAERRRAASQQYAGDGGKESVVDTLTRQLANVPQNIQAPMRAPPKMPQPMMQPQMAGIGALPQGQQKMSEGGPVRRFAAAGYVEPMWSIPDYSGVIPRVGDWVGGKTKELYEYATTPWGQSEAGSPSFVPGSDLDISLPDIALPKTNSDFATTGEPSTYTDLTPKPKKDPSSTTGTQDTSPENKYKAMEADMRKRLEGLYGDEEASGWENAQKWFAASQQIMNPDATLMQSLVNAGAAFSDISGEQAAEQRRSAQAREEALLNYDLQIMQADRANEAAAAARADDRDWEREKLNMIGGKTLVEAYLEQIKSLDRKITETFDVDEKARLAAQLDGLQMKLAELTKTSGPSSGGVVGRAEYDALNLGAR